MTCIAGIVDEFGKIYMAADSLWSDEHSCCATPVPKLFSAGELLIAFAGSPRTGQVLQHGLVVRYQKEEEEDMEYLVNFLIPKIISTLKGASAMLAAHDIPLSQADLLLGYRGNLYAVQEDFSIFQSPFPFYAMGSGGDVALGALYATAGYDGDPEERLELAIDIAAEFVPTVGGDVVHLNSDDLEDA